MEPEQLTNTVSERPVASALARLQAERGMLITNQRHEPVSLDEFSRNVLLQLDGTRDQAALVAAMAKLAADKVLMFKQGDEPLLDPAAIEQFLRQGVPVALERMAKLGLLVS
jgi:methyltransferase-like protein